MEVWEGVNGVRGGKMVEVEETGVGGGGIVFVTSWELLVFRDSVLDLDCPLSSSADCEIHEFRSSSGNQRVTPRVYVN